MTGNGGDPFDGTIEYSSECKAYRTTYEPRLQTPSSVLVEAIAAIEGKDGTALEHLYHEIEPDALNSLLQSAAERGVPVQVEFSAYGYEITIQSGGTILFQPSPQDEDSRQDDKPAQ